jgi:hypothetical protein
LIKTYVHAGNSSCGEESKGSVEASPAGKPKEFHVGSQDEGREKAPLLTKESLTEEKEERQGEQGEKGGREASRTLRHPPEDRSRCCHQPKEERRLVEVDLAVEVWNDPSLTLQHLFGNLGIARFIRIPEIPPSQIVEKEYPAKGKQDEEE